jgi:hypothetical protein
MALEEAVDKLRVVRPTPRFHWKVDGALYPPLQWMSGLLAGVRLGTIESDPYIVQRG